MPQTRVASPVLAVILSCVVLLAGFLPGRAQDMATPDYATPSVTTTLGDLIEPPVILWRTPLGMAPVYDQPTPGVGEGLVVTSGPAGLVAVDAATGAERWHVEQPVSASSPLVQDGKVFVGTAGEGVKAFDATTGDEVWQFLSGDTAVPDNAPPDSIDSSPVIADGVLYTGQGGYGGLYALDPATGAKL